MSPPPGVHHTPQLPQQPNSTHDCMLESLWNQACPQFSDIAATLTTVHDNIHHLLDTIHRHDAQLAAQRSQILHLEAINREMKGDFDALLKISTRQNEQIDELQHRLDATQSTQHDSHAFLETLNGTLQQQHNQTTNLEQLTTRHQHRLDV
eukprot:2641541-Amphidinium_carterae.1